MIKFRQKEFSLVENVVRGALLGGAIASGSGTVMGKLNKKAPFPFFKEKRQDIWDNIEKTEQDKSDMFKNKDFNKDKLEALNKKTDRFKMMDNVYLSMGGAIVGAALGALWTAGEWAAGKFRKKAIVNQCLDQVITNLKKIGFKEGQHFTKDKRIADNLKTKITIAIIKSSGNLIVLVNSKNDPKLNKLNNEIIKNLPTESVTQKESDKFNDITITSMSSNEGDSVFISSLAEKFIRSGFSVYLIEVSN